MDPYKLKPKFEYKKGLNKLNDELMNPEKKLKGGKRDKKSKRRTMKKNNKDYFKYNQHKYQL